MNCNHCGHAIPGKLVSFWDGGTYCATCVKNESPGLLSLALRNGGLEESVTSRDLGAMNYVAYMGRLALIAALLVFGVPLAIPVVLGKLPVVSYLIFLAFVGGFVFAFTSLQAFVGMRSMRKQVPRAIAVCDGIVRIGSPEKSESVDLSACTWLIGSTSNDQLTWFTKLRRGVILRTPEQQVALGFSPESFDRWQAFFRLAGVRVHTPPTWFRLLIVTGVGAGVGVLIGVAVGSLVASVTTNPMWRSAIGILGFLDGGFIALLPMTASWVSLTEGRNRLHPGVVGTGFFLLGFKVGWVGGWVGAFVCGGVNAVIGIAVALHCRARLDHEDAERQFEEGALNMRHRRESTI